jgi:hypothetical protein
MTENVNQQSRGGIDILWEMTIIAFLCKTQRISERLKFPWAKQTNSWLLAKLAARSFLLADYFTVEAFLFEALRLDSSNYLAWSQLGLLFAEGDVCSYQAEECHCLALLAAEGKVDCFTESSRFFLAAVGIKDPENFARQRYGRNKFPDVYQG